MLLPKVLRADIQRYSGQVRLSAWAAIRVVATDPGALAGALFRLQAAATSAGLVPLARLIRTITVILTGADFGVGASIGPGLRIVHPVGIVVGAAAKLGAACTLYQHVTIGRKDVAGDDAYGYPRIGDGVSLFVGACVLGPVTVGHGATVGAMAIVLADVRPGDTVVGIVKSQTSHRKSQGDEGI